MSDNSTNSFSYKGSPAWRNDWFAFAVLGFFCLLSIIMSIGAVAASNDASAPSAASMLLIPWGITAIVAIGILYRHYSWSYTVEDGRISSNHGIISQDTQSIRVADLRNVNLKQSVFQRIFKVGDLEFSSSGGSGIEVAFYGIHAPKKLLAEIQNLQE